jgi:hypothetical protein
MGLIEANRPVVTKAYERPAPGVRGVGLSYVDAMHCKRYQSITIEELGFTEKDN